MSEEHAIQVNFGKPMPLFPLDVVTLLPQQVLPLHIFEPRYRQMVETALDGPGQIAMAVYKGNEWKQQHHGRPPIHPAVCVGHIVQHEKLEDGRFNVLLQGICRARIIKESPGSETRLYREAIMEPVGVEGLAGTLPPDLAEVRERLDEMLSNEPLSQMAAAEPICEYLRNEELPTHAILEFVSFAVVTDHKTRYLLLAEGDVGERAKVILHELEALAALLRRALCQRRDDVPKGCNWN